MKRSLSPLLLLAIALPACKSAGPKAGPLGPAAAPELLRPYVGQLRFLRHKGEERVLTVKGQERPAGSCEMAVRIRSAAFEKGGVARFSLETLGLPRVNDRNPSCRKLQPGLQLVLAGLPEAPAAEGLATRIDAVLQTPEGFLQARGVAFDLAAIGPPTELASPDATAAGIERVRGMKVTAWPKVLLAVHPMYHDPSGRVRQESEVEFEAVVGADGRLYEPVVRTPLTDTHAGAALAALSLWRLEPARMGEEPVGARLRSRLSLRIY